MARRQHLTLTVLLAFVLFFSITYLFSGSSRSTDHASALKSSRGTQAPLHDAAKAEHPTSKSISGSKSDFAIDIDAIPNLAEGESIAPKLENATLKAELGRATWKFLHTMVARFPEKPTESDRKTLDSFFRLFGRLYPCGECARHFRELLKEYPPQTSSRNAAAGWLCTAHNKVNERLGKPQYDCSKLDYDCGCGDEDKITKEEDEDGDAETDKRTAA